jgi:hypothetical protein
VSGFSTNQSPNYGLEQRTGMNEDASSFRAGGALQLTAATVPSSLEQARKALAKSWEQTSSSWRYALGSARSPVLVNPVLFPCSPVGRGLRVYHAVQDSLLLTVSMPHRTAVCKDRTLYGPAPRIHVALRWNARWHSGGRLIFLFVLFKNIFYN